MADEVQVRFGWTRRLEISYTCASATLAGRIVERTTGTRLVQHAGAGSLLVVGVGRWDVPASAAYAGGPVVGAGNELSVVRGVVIEVQYAAAATVGAKLIAAANGEVTPAGATPDARTVVGECFEAIGGAGRGLAYIY